MGWPLAIAAIAAVASAGSQVYSANRQAKAEKKMRNQQQASQYEQQLVERRNLIRERRIKQAQLMQASEAYGTSGSSGEIGALGSMATQFNSGQSFLDSQQQIAKNIAGIQNRLNKDLFKATVVGSTAKAVGSVAGSGILGKTGDGGTGTVQTPTSASTPYMGGPRFGGGKY